MKKKKGPTFQNHGDDNVEKRDYVVYRDGFDPPSSRYIIFDCPFCQTQVKAFVWSLCGGGKRCDCGAMFGSGGGALHFKKDKY